jgi:hypothetical protein
MLHGCKMGRTIVIGDIHGCYDELIELLNKLTLAPEDQVVAVGDLTAKGPKSREVLDLFSNDQRFSSVLGNHDLALVRHWRGENVALKPSQRAALAELQTPDGRYLRYLTSLPLLINLNSHVVVHAGVRPGVALDEQSADDLVELRTLGENRTSRKGIPWFRYSVIWSLAGVKTADRETRYRPRYRLCLRRSIDRLRHRKRGILLGRCRCGLF